MENQKKIFRKISEYFYVNTCISVKKVVYLYSWKKGRRQAPVQGTEANKREFLTQLLNTKTKLV